MPRKPRCASLALTVSFGLLVTGCASQNTRTAAPVDTHQTNTPVTQAAQPAATSAARAPIEPDENVVQLDYTPHQWPDPRGPGRGFW